MKQTIAKMIVGAVAAIVGCVGFSFAATTTTSTLGQVQQGASGVPVAGADNLTGSDSLINTVKKFISLVLGFLGTIAFVILLYGGFQMVTAAGDDGKYKAGFKILRQSAIGLIFIGLAALVIQLIFWILGAIGG